MKKTLALLGIVCSVGACQGLAEFPDENDVASTDVQAGAVSGESLLQRVEYVDEEGNVLEVRYQEVAPQFQVLAPGGDFGLEYRDRRQQDFEANIDPQVYAIVARRALNKMLDETGALYETEEDEVPSLYIRDAKIYDDRLPDGFYQAQKETQKLLENSHTFRLTNSKYEADYFLETEIDTVELKDYDTPVIVYRLILLNQRNGVIKEWKENIRKLKNDDRSWW